MSILNKIVKRKNKALNVFRVAKSDLEKVVEDTVKAVDVSIGTVDKLNARIEFETTVQDELELEKTEMLTTIVNINKILGSS